MAEDFFLCLVLRKTQSDNTDYISIFYFCDSLEELSWSHSFDNSVYKSILHLIDVYPSCCVWSYTWLYEPKKAQWTKRKRNHQKKSTNIYLVILAYFIPSEGSIEVKLWRHIDRTGSECVYFEKIVKVVKSKNLLFYFYHWSSLRIITCLWLI